MITLLAPGRYAMSPSDVEMLRKVQRHILEEPRRFAMGLLQSEGEAGEFLAIPSNASNAWNQHESRRLPACGTVACIMGWAQLLGGGDGRIPERLYLAAMWPKHFRDLYAAESDMQRRAEIASARIDWFIERGG